MRLTPKGEALIIQALANKIKAETDVEALAIEEVMKEEYISLNFDLTLLHRLVRGVVVYKQGE